MYAVYDAATGPDRGPSLARVLDSGWDAGVFTRRGERARGVHAPKFRCVAAVAEQRHAGGYVEDEPPEMREWVVAIIAR